MRSFVFFAQTGCLLPFLITFNLFFGWMFFKPLHWFLIESVLVLIFVINAAILMKKMTSFVSPRARDVVDVEGEVVEEKRKLGQGQS